MDSKYPTREQIVRLQPAECESQQCQGCDIAEWCGDNNPAILEAMLAMHDEIDRLKHAGEEK